MNRMRTLLRSCVLLLLVLPLGLNAREPSQPDKRDRTTPTATELISQAVANFRNRESRAQDYVWREDHTTRMSFRDRGTKYRIFPASRSDSYEVIPLAGSFYRRHLTHNDRVLPQHDETLEQQWVAEALRKSMDEGVKFHPLRDRSIRDQSLEVSYVDATATADPRLAEPQLIGSEIRRSIRETVGTAGDDASIFFTAQVFQRGLPDLQFPLDQLTDRFDLRLSRSETFNGRPTYVVDAVPKKAGAANADETGGNFKITIWVDQIDLEIVKTEEKAIREGVISSRPVYVAMDWQNYSQGAVATAKSIQYDQSLLYEPGTVITREWARIDNAVWMLKSLVVKGEEVFSSADVSSTGKVRRIAPHILVEHEQTYSGYQKFRVRTRIFGATTQ